MPNEPSLGEILNNADPERGTGTPAVVYDNRELLHNLNDAAQFRAENDWRKYNTFLSNVKDQYKDLGQIQAMETLDKDKEQLQKEAADIYANIAKNPREFFAGGAKMNELQSRIGKLQQLSTESKQNALFDFAHRQYLYRNPDLDTPENKQKIDQYISQPLGQRNPYILDLPGLYNPQELAGGINDLVKQDTANSEVTPDNQFIQTTKKTTYDPERYRTIANAFYDMPDSRGVPLRDTLKKRFDTLPDNVKKFYGGQKDPVRAWYLDTQELYRKPDQELKDDLKPNPGYLEKEKLAQKAANDRRELALGYAKYDLDKDKFDKASNEDLGSADSVIRDVTDKIWKGYNKEGIFGKTSSFQISDAETLQHFGKLDRDGTTIKVPDQITYNKNKGELQLVFNAYTDAKKVEHPEERKPIDEREWVSTVVKNKFPNKDIGSINNIVSDIITKKGNLFNLAKELNGQSGSYKLDGKQYSEEQVEKAANQSGLSVEEYVKQAGFEK